MKRCSPCSSLARSAAANRPRRASIGPLALAGLIAGALLLDVRGSVAQERVSPLPAYRPSSLSDLVDAVSLNRDGLEDADLSGDVADHAMFLGETDGVGIAARLQADPDGPLFIGWQHRRASWRHRWLDDDTVAGVRVPQTAAIRLGRVGQFRAVGDHLVLETHTDDAAASVVMGRDLSPAAFVSGRVAGGLPAGTLVLLHSTGEGADRVETLERLDVGTRRLDRFHAVRAPLPAATPPDDAPAIGVAIRDIAVDGRTSTVTFSVRAAGDQSPARVTCALLTTPVRCTRQQPHPLTGRSMR